MALEGETEDSSLPGLVIRWKQLRFAAYDALNLREEQRKLALELLFAGNFEYYGELKKEIYDRHIRSEAAKASNRNAYQSVCRLLQRYGKIAGAENQRQLIEELKMQYARRPAFVDELMMCAE